MSARRSVVTGVVVLWVSLALPWSAAAQLKVDLEVTQGIQYFEHDMYGTNTMTLVAQRPTAVRTRIQGVPEDKDVKSVNGELVIEPMPDPLPTISKQMNPERFMGVLNGRAPWDRNDPDSTLNFRVDSLVKGSWDFKVKVELVFTDGVSMSGAGNAKLDAVEVRPVEVRFVPMQFKTASKVVYEPPDLGRLEAGFDLLQGCFPLPMSDTAFVWQPAQALPHKDNKPCPGRIDDMGKQSEVSDILNDLGAMVVSTVKKPGTAPPDLFYYGFAQPRTGQVTLIANDSCMDTLGWASCQARAAFGTADLDLAYVAPKVLAHEFGHLLGLDHCDACTGATKPCHLDDQVGFDVRTMTTRPPKAYTSFMTCGVVSGDAVWMTPEDYKYALDALKVGSTTTPCSAPGPQPDPAASWSLVVRGAVSPQGQDIEWVDPVFRYPWKVSPTPAGATGPFEIRVTDGTQTVVRRFDALMHVERVNGVGTQVGFFSVVLPFPEKPKADSGVVQRRVAPGDEPRLLFPGTAPPKQPPPVSHLKTAPLEPPPDLQDAPSVVEDLTILRSGNVIFTMTRSQTPPVIGIVSPQPGTILSQQPVTVQWTVTDPDLPPMPRLHQLVYSHDGGQSFEPVAVNLDTGTAIFDPGNFLSSGPEQGILRILVTDGLNTAVKDIGSLTVQ